MPKRFLSIWLPYLVTDSIIKYDPDLKDKAFVLSFKEKGRMIIKAASPLAVKEGIGPGKVLADARAILPGLHVMDHEPATAPKLLLAMAEWCVRFAPLVAVDGQDGLLLDISGCSHLWGGEEAYMRTITGRFGQGGYHVRAAIADTIGTAWAMARFAMAEYPIVASNEQAAALALLPPEALRLAHPLLQSMQQLGFRMIGQFMNIPPQTLRRRFGDALLQRLGQGIGSYPEVLKPVVPAEPYIERLPCLEPIGTATGIRIALEALLQATCSRLQKENKGIRTAIFKAYRIDGDIQRISIGTNRASHNVRHLFGLFEQKIPTIEPALGIELFALEVPAVEDAGDTQEKLWSEKGAHTQIARSLDNIAGKVGAHTIKRYLPVAQHWPERSIKLATSLTETPAMPWPVDKFRPIQLLSRPEPIDVMVPLPDYPPLLFIHKGKVFKLSKADGPERIEQEWWISEGLPRDYYRVEDERGARYWIFRSGHYAEGNAQWFLHGFFA